MSADLTQGQLVQLSRAVSRVLRHKPWLYELELDEEGWVATAELLKGLQSDRPEWAALTEHDLARMNNVSTKRRFELHEERIRALYGHSVAGKLQNMASAPPDVLFHGTSPTNIPRIQVTGLRPMRRQYVHLSSDVETALLVGRRKAPRPVILRILAREAHASGVRFYVGNEQVWLADEVTPSFIDFSQDTNSA